MGQLGKVSNEQWMCGCLFSELEAGRLRTGPWISLSLAQTLAGRDLPCH